jgi:leucyl/phenylalanyl-tRNA---protein transferase
MSNQEATEKFLSRFRGKTHNIYFRLLLALLRLVPDAGSKLTCLLEAKQQITPEQLILNYARGLFPMGQDSKIRWKEPATRAVIQLENGGLRMGKELTRIVRQKRFEITFDQAFREVVLACSERSRTWITPQIIDIYEELHRWGVAHSFEAWHDGKLVGGNYGVALGSIYMGESMFHRVSNAGNVAFVHQAEHLRQMGFTLIDCQYPTEYLLKLGAKVINRAEYRQYLARGLAGRPSFGASLLPSAVVPAADPVDGTALAPPTTAYAQA